MTPPPWYCRSSLAQIAAYASYSGSLFGPNSRRNRRRSHARWRSIIGQCRAREIEIARPQQMPEQGIDVDQVHVVVTVGDGRRCCAARPDSARDGWPPRRVATSPARRQCSGASPSIQMPPRAVMPAERIHHVRSAPAEQARAPRDGAMHHDLLRLIPQRIRRDVQRSHGGVEIWIRRAHRNAFAQRAKVLARACENLGQFIDRVSRRVAVWRRRGARRGADVAVGVELGCGSGALRNSLQGQKTHLARVERHARDQHRFRRRGVARDQQLIHIAPVPRIAERQSGVARQHPGDARHGTAQLECIALEREGVVATEFRSELEPLADGTRSVPMSPSRTPR